MSTKKLRVGLIFGGESAEHEVSGMSIRNIRAALEGFDKFSGNRGIVVET